MTAIREAYLDAAATAAGLLGDPAVAGAWDAPSALPEFRVSGLAGHLARQITIVPRLLAMAEPDGMPVITLMAHYARATWIGAGVDADVNVSTRRGGEEEAAGGCAALTALAHATVGRLRGTLPAEPAGRLVPVPWGPWVLSLDDFLTTRLLEIAVHSDDLAVSVGVPTPPLDPPALDPVLALLTRLAVRRHGQAAVLRALSRAERAPATIAAI